MQHKWSINWPHIKEEATKHLVKLHGEVPKHIEPLELRPFNGGFVFVMDVYIKNTRLRCGMPIPAPPRQPPPPEHPDVEDVDWTNLHG